MIAAHNSTFEDAPKSFDCLRMDRTDNVLSREAAKAQSHEWGGGLEDWLNDAADEIERLRGALTKYADWIDGVYSSLPSDQAPGPPRQLLKEMRESVLVEQTASEK